MLVIFKGEDGGYHIRPMYIGSIKNNIVRRTACLVLAPLTMAFTLVFNLIQAAFVCCYVIIRAVAHPIIKYQPLWKTQLWDRPRTEIDKHSTMKK